MNALLIAALALGYSGLVLFGFAHALGKTLAPMRAALIAFLVSTCVHGATMLFLDAEHRLTALVFWGLPHLMLLPALIYSAWRQSRGSVA
ncbi:MAG: hypothetical protein JWR10_956 [Rubritepida sp.]|nr:hypothetical protein [Rubritepida sp.]